ncbi:MAG: hypothetical protein R3181_11120 [Rubricoccaceae bacterium]|nr:hypothetical protein [Rubricoccaceae bacterium]
MRSVLLPALAVLLAAPGCGSPRPVGGSPDATRSRMARVALDDVFEVQRGGAVLLEGQRLRFEAVLSDSRCPADVNCVRAGEAVTAFSFVGPRSIGEVRLQIPGYADAETEPRPEQSATRGGLRFTLLALTPYPGTPEAEGEARPVATLRAERIGD